MRPTPASPDVSYRWAPLTDLPDDWRSIASDQLPALAQVWSEQRDRLSARMLQDFHERLQREWAIETGVIERLYSLDRGVTQILIERGLDAAIISHEDTDSDPQLVIASR